MGGHADDFLAAEEDVGEEGGGANPNPDYDYNKLAEALHGNGSDESSDGAPDAASAGDASELSDEDESIVGEDGDDAADETPSDDDDDGAIMERALVDTSDDASSEGRLSDGGDDDDDASQAGGPEPRGHCWGALQPALKGSKIVTQSTWA